MRTRSGFVSNSSSASFIVGIPSTDKNQVLNMLFENFEHDYFGKYYLRESIGERKDYAKKRLDEANLDFEKMAKVSKEDRLASNPSRDPLEWKASSVKQWLNSYNKEEELLKTLEDIDDTSEKELVEFGLSYHGISLSPTYTPEAKQTKLVEASDPHNVSQYDRDATDDTDLVVGEIQPEPSIIGYQLSDWVTMFNEYGDCPRMLRSMTGVLAFIYKDLKCWVEDEG